MSPRRKYMLAWTTRLSQVLLLLLLVLIPSNLFLSLPTGAEYQSGFRIDYLIPKLYVTDLIGISLLVLWLVERWLRTGPWRLLSNNWGKSINSWLTQSNRVVVVIWLSSLSILLLRNCFTAEPLLSWVTIGRIIGLVLLTVAIVPLIQRSNRVVMLGLTAGLILQNLVGWWQWLVQTSLTPYWLLGEPQLSGSLGLTHIVWLAGAEKILPYGTTTHPNVLAGYMAIALIALLVRSSTIARIWRWPLVVLALSSISLLLITQSLSALLALIIGGLTWWWSRGHRPATLSRATFAGILIGSWLVVSVLLAWLGLTTRYPSVLRRAQLQQAGVGMVLKQPYLGTGVNTSLIESTHSNTYIRESTAFIQPIHSIFWLYVVETGLIGIIFFCTSARLFPVGWFAPRLSIVLLAILPFALLDHYLLTLQTGLLLLILYPALLTEMKQ